MAGKKEKRNAEIVKAYKSGKRAMAHGISKTRVCREGGRRIAESIERDSSKPINLEDINA